MAEAGAARLVFRFEAFELDVQSGDLRGPGGVVSLHEKPLAALTALVERPGQVVTREALRRRLWPDDTHVDYDNNLNATVKKLRDALGDSPAAPRFIETLPRKGYRFIAPVVRVDGADAAVAVPARGSVRRRAALALAAVAIVAAVLWLARPSQPAPPPAGKITLAVTPFQNLTGSAEDDYICDGLTEEMIAHLGRLDPERLGVIARISAMAYKGTAKSVAQIGRELGAEYLIEGSVRRRGDRWRITVQLIRTDDQTHLWAENYDLPWTDVFDMQRDVSLRTARSMAVELLAGRTEAMARAATDDAQAHLAYLRGRHHWFRFKADDHVAAIRHFERAIARDPGFALAFAGMADAYNLLAGSAHMTAAEAFARAKQAARAALAADPQCAEAHNALAFALLYGDFDFAAADRAFQQAVALSPGYAMGHHWRAGLFSALGRHDEALTAMDRALALDPVSLSVKSDLGWYYLFADRYDEARRELEETLAMNPHYGWAAAGLFWAWRKQERWDEAWRAKRLSMRLDDFDEAALAPLDALPPRHAVAAAWRLALDRAEARERAGETPYALGMAVAYAAAGDRVQALAWLERMWPDRDGWLVFLDVDPRLDGLKGEPRFAALRAKIGLPAETAGAAVE